MIESRKLSILHLHLQCQHNNALYEKIYMASENALDSYRPLPLWHLLVCT
jgi:hypothetical protein